MTESLLVVKIITCLLSVMLASMIISRDLGLRVTRLMGMVPVCTAYWSLCEIFWNLQEDPEGAAFWIRASSLGWMLLGAVALHAFNEIILGQRPLVKKLLPWAYGCGVASCAIYAFTPYGLDHAFRAEWGWSYEFGPLIIPLYLASMWPLTLVIGSWGMELPGGRSIAERKVWLSIYLAVVIALVIASISDITLPLMGIHEVPPLGSTSIVLVCIGVAYRLHRYGYSLLSPGAFANEILETLRDGVVLLRVDGRIHSSNGAFQRLMGLDSEALRGEVFAAFVPSIPENPSELTRSLECELVTHAGERIPVMIVPAQMNRTQRRPRGGALLIRDLREVRALRDHLVASGRMAAVGEISESLSEEIMEPTMNMRHHLVSLQNQQMGLVREDASRMRDPQIEELLHERDELVAECIEGVDRIAKILEEVQGFSVARGRPRQRADLNRLAEEAIRIAAARAHPDMCLEARLEGSAAIVCAPSEIVQVIVNLLVNAIQAVATGGRITCETRTDDTHARLTVRDNGVGIRADVLDRIFDPFFTTKPVGEGTGLGLAISQHLVRQHGGELQVDSEPGRGTCVTLVLPAKATT